jgi:hypothetical protein
MKQELKIALAEKIEGTTLCNRYNAIIDNRLKSNFPSASGIYTTLCLGLHTREVSSDEFESLREKLLDHFKGKLLFDKYSQQPTNQ